MMLLRPQTPTSQPMSFSSPPSSRKRKADLPPESNERLSKRLSLLNLEQNGQQKLYVPVENAQRSNYTTVYTPSSGYVTRPVVAVPPEASPSSQPNAAARSSQGGLADDGEEQPMQLDNTKHKVYIYNIDEELSSESEAEDERRVVFLPDIEKHLRRSRIPQAVLMGGGSPGVGGVSPEEAQAMQMVLYRVPSSISVPEEQDSVRKAIIEARHRLREKQQQQQGQQQQQQQQAASRDEIGGSGVGEGMGVAGGEVAMEDDDSDAMELD